MKSSWWIDMQMISETKLPLCIFWQFEKEGGLGAQWIISLSLTPELILVLVTETHLQDRTNCLSSQHAFLQAGPHFYRASSHYQFFSSTISVIQSYSARGPNTSYSSQRQDVCVGLLWKPMVRIVVGQKHWASNLMSNLLVHCVDILLDFRDWARG